MRVESKNFKVHSIPSEINTVECVTHLCTPPASKGRRCPIWQLVPDTNLCPQT